MEIDQRLQLEMTEVLYDVYDFAHPTPVSLQELSAIAVSLQIWRRQVEKYRQNGTLTELRPKKERISLKTALPDLPSMIYNTIEAYFTEFGRSLEIWLIYHHARVYFRYEHKNLVLNDFDDFVCDYLGKIDYVRTAERMMSCDRFNVDEKFIIACICFFEDDIRRLWPSVSSKMHLNGDDRGSQPVVWETWGKMNLDFINFDPCPQLYYWVKCFKTLSGNTTLASWHDDYDEEEMFDVHRCSIRLSLEYFWDRLPLECKMRKAIELHDMDMVCFISIILPKLDDQQLDEFVKKRGRHMISKLLEFERFDEGVVLRIWFYIRNIMNERSFARMIAEMLQLNYYRSSQMTDDHEDDAEDDNEGEGTDDDEEDSKHDDEHNDNSEEESKMEDDDSVDEHSKVRAKKYTFDSEAESDSDEDSRMEDYDRDSVDEYRYQIEISHDDDDDDSSSSPHCWRGAIDLVDGDRVNLCNCEPRKWDSYLHFCCEIWNTTPHNLKRSIIKGISVDSRLLRKMYTGNINSSQINVELLLLILRCASLEERMSFWQNCWPLLIAAARGDDLQRIAALCFEDEQHQMNEFKQNIIASSDHIRKFCFQLLRNGEYFDYLTELVSFVWPEEQNARNFKQQILRECFLDTRSKFEYNIVLYHKKFDDFITDAFDSVYLSTEFKTQLMLSSVIQNTLWRLIYRGSVSVQQVSEFMGTFVTTEETLEEVKMNMIDIVKAYVNTTSRGREYLSNRPEIKSILLWCLKSEEEVEEFKLNCIS